MITIRVYWSDGKPAKNAKVWVTSDGFWSNKSIEGFTSNNGDVDLNIEPCEGKVYVDNKEVYHGSISGRLTVYK